MRRHFLVALVLAVVAGIGVVTPPFDVLRGLSLDVLTGLRESGFRVGACTSGDRATQTAALQAIGLWDLIEEMQTPDDSQFGKPDPRYLQELLAKFPGHGQVHHVEDSEVGLFMGRDCGAVTYFAAYGNGSLSGGIKPDFVLAGIEELPMAVLRSVGTKP